MRKTKKRSKYLHIAIDSLKPGRDNRMRSGIMSDGARSASKAVFGLGFGMNAKFRKRKNFSLILLAGLSALLCALYYTSYYPGTVWTLRFGLTSFAGRNNNATNSQQTELLSDTAAANNIIPGSLSHPNPGADGPRSHGENSPSADGFSRSGRSSSAVNNGSVIPSKNDDGNNHHNSNERSGGEGGGGETNSEEISSTPKEWNWRYWASLAYWKVNLTTDEDFSGKPSEKLAGGTEGSAQLPDFSESVTLPIGRSLVGNSASASSSSVAKSASSADFSRKKKKREGLACKFPRLNPFDPSITDFIKGPPDIDCAKEYPAVFKTNFRNKLIQFRHPFQATAVEKGEGEQEQNRVSLRTNYTCCYKTITRGNGSDHSIIYSKRCYPILKAESVIPATHEFISVRCRIVGNRTKSVPKVVRDGNGYNHTNSGNNYTSTNTDNNSNSNGSGAGSGSSNTTTKVYKDMMAFVPLKPWVEDRIRKYEESKRKFLYSLKKAGSSSNKSGLGKNGRKEKGRVINTQQQAQQAQYPGINLVEENGFYRHQATPHKKDYKVGEWEEETNEDRLSVLILGLDAQSHMNFIRQMPQTYNFLTKNLSAIGMYGYTKVGDNTFPNVVASLGGLTETELEKTCWPTKQSYFDSCPFIWKKFAESGYRTSLAEDSVWMGTFNYDKKGFLHQPTDYYLHPLTLLMAKRIGHESWGNAKLCYGPRLAFQVLLDYIVKTAVTFRDSLYFQFVWSNSLFHDYLNNPRLGDELLVETLQYLRNNNFLNKTLFILLSDHGIRWGGIRSTYQGKIEERMPLVYFTFPTWFRDKYPSAMGNLRRNAMRLTTPFDLHETLQDILRISHGKRIRFDRWRDEGSNNDIKSSYRKSRAMSGVVVGDGESDEKPPRGISLFRPIPLGRTCSQAGIDEHWCVCHSMQTVHPNSTLVMSGAAFIVQVINGLVRKHSGLCAKLTLFKINEAKRKIDGDIDRGLDVDFSAAKGGSNPVKVNHSLGQRRTPANSEAGMESTDSSTSTHGGDHKFRKTETLVRNENELEEVTVSTSTVSDSSREETEVSSLSTSSDIKKMVQLQITLVTRPGDAIFEATIYGEAVIGNGPVSDQDIHQEEGQRSHHHWKLAGDISRLNLYGSQSSCISDYTLLKYCYCHETSN